MLGDAIFSSCEFVGRDGPFPCRTIVSRFGRIVSGCGLLGDGTDVGKVGVDGNGDRPSAPMYSLSKVLNFHPQKTHGWQMVQIHLVMLQMCVFVNIYECFSSLYFEPIPKLAMYESVHQPLSFASRTNLCQHLLGNWC